MTNNEFSIFFWANVLKITIYINLSLGSCLVAKFIEITLLIGLYYDVMAMVMVILRFFCNKWDIIKWQSCETIKLQRIWLLCTYHIKIVMETQTLANWKLRTCHSLINIFILYYAYEWDLLIKRIQVSLFSFVFYISLENITSSSIIIIIIMF